MNTPHSTERNSSDRPLHILVPILNYHPLIGGAELFTKRVAEELALAGTAHTTIVTRRVKDCPDTETINEVNVIRTGSVHTNLHKVSVWDGFKAIWPVYRESLRFIRNHENPDKQPIDLIHANGFLSGLIALMLKRKTGIPYALTNQSGDTAVNYPRWNFSLIKYLKKLVYRKATVTHAVSKHIATMFEAAQSCDVRTIPNGVDVARFAHASGDRVRKKYEIGPDEVLIGCVSRLTPVHGVDILLDACAQMQATLRSSEHDSTRTTFRLLIVGDGKQRKELESMVDRLGLRDITTFTGNAAYDDIPSYFAAFDIFARPSRAEGFGITYLESMAAGCVTVGSDVGGIPDIITHEVDGLMTPPQAAAQADVLLNLVQNPELRKKYAEAGLIRAQGQDWSVIASRIATLYHDAINYRKVVFAAGIYPPDIGGPATFTRDIAHALFTQGHDVEVVTYSNVISEPFPVHRISTVKHTRGIFAPLTRYMRYAKELRSICTPDTLLIITSPISAGIPYLLSGLRCRGALRLGGDAYFEHMTTRGKKITLSGLYSGRLPLLMRIYHWYLSLIIRRTSAALFNSEYYRSLFATLHKDLPTVFVPNATDCPCDRDARHDSDACSCDDYTGNTTDCNEISQDASQRIRDHENYFLFIGRLLPVKQIDLLIDSFARARAKGLTSRLVIIGDGPQRDALISLASELTISEYIDFHHAMPRTDLAPYYQNARALVLPSLSDIGPNVILEAKSYGLPVIATSENGFADVCEVVFDPLNIDTLVTALQDFSDPTAIPVPMGTTQHPEDVARQIITLLT